jgi:hypothetical protein
MIMENETAEVINDNLPSVIPGDREVLDPEQMMKNAMARAEIVEKMRELAIKSTKPNDWINYGDKPGISGPGAERAARTIGLIAFDVRASTEDLPDSEYIIYMNGKMGFRGGEYIEATGSCCSTKPFFTAKAKDSPVNPGDIHKNALTNFYVNGVTRFLGLRGLTWEDLKEIGGEKFTPDKAQTIDYKSAKNIERTEEDSNVLGVVWEWLLEMNVGDVANAKKQLQKLTAFSDFPGYTNIKKVSPKMVDKLSKKVEKLYENWGKEANGTTRKSGSKTADTDKNGGPPWGGK